MISNFTCYFFLIQVKLQVFYRGLKYLGMQSKGHILSSACAVGLYDESEVLNGSTFLFVLLENSVVCTWTEGREIDDSYQMIPEDYGLSPKSYEGGTIEIP